MVGFGKRMSKELNEMIHPVQIAVIEPPDRKISSWIGGSRMISRPSFEELWISRAQYDQSGPMIIHKKTLHLGLMPGVGDKVDSMASFAERDIQWPPAGDVLPHEDHLTLGINADTAQRFFDAIDFPAAYSRDETTLGWVTSGYGPDICGYDVCAAVKQFLKANYNPFSACEVMLHTKAFSGLVGKADVFLSHVQSELVETTLGALRPYNYYKFFIDYFALRQCQNDFTLPMVEEAIRTIGDTRVLCDPLHAPTVLKRTFCIFEMYATVAGKSKLGGLLAPSAINDLGKRDGASLADILESLPAADVRAAEARRPEDKAMIELYIAEGPGFEAVNEIVQRGMQRGVVNAAVAAGLISYKEAQENFNF